MAGVVGVTVTGLTVTGAAQGPGRSGPPTPSPAPALSVSVTLCLAAPGAGPIYSCAHGHGPCHVSLALAHLSFAILLRAQKFARSIGACDAGTFAHTGGCDDALCDKIKAGMVLQVDLHGDKAMSDTVRRFSTVKRRMVSMSNDPALLAKFCEALKSATCRVTKLK